MNDKAGDRRPTGSEAPAEAAEELEAERRRAHWRLIEAESPSGTALREQAAEDLPDEVEEEGKKTGKDYV
ncbi:hypothetical protein AB0436_18795 [Streptomyces sp. NPDC051322]|uniref:hypothetical protein n=1 Tax=Streptomyces sp. NPDC051322 TaxID=3154645 RepID=UPI00344BD546